MKNTLYHLDKIVVPLWITVFVTAVFYIIYPPEDHDTDPKIIAIICLLFAFLYISTKKFHKYWLQSTRERNAWETLSDIAEKHSDPLLKQTNPGPPIFGNAKSIEIYPDEVKHVISGWPLNMVKFLYANESYKLPAEHQALYAEYFKDNEEEFARDGDKLCLSVLPKVYSDGERHLTLRMKNTKYSVVRFTNDRIAKIPDWRKVALTEMFGNRKVTFANSLCLHSIIFTADLDPLCLVVRRNKDMAWHGGKLAASIEEQIKFGDLKGSTRHGPLGKWVSRQLKEEMSLYEDDGHFDLNNCKVLSLFLEGDIFNISLCTIIKLSITQQELDSILHGCPRSDYEFSTWKYLSLSELRSLLLEDPEELLEDWHPTSGYRIMMALMHFGYLAK